VSRVNLALAALAMAIVAPVGEAKCDEAPQPPVRDLSPAPPPKPTSQPRPVPNRVDREGAAGLSKLIAGGSRAEVATVPASTARGCGIAAPVRLSSVVLPSGEVVGLPDQPILECQFAFVLADYVRLVVAPLGAATLGSRVVSIETGPGFECSDRNRLVGGKISAHGKGLAVDVVAVAFANKRRVSIEHQDSTAEASFMRAMRLAACGWFTTVLGPGTDAFHANNMHLDIEEHGSNGNYRICE
jgi:hypothetical protein